MIQKSSSLKNPKIAYQKLTAINPSEQSFYQKKTAGPDQNEIIKYASIISSNNLDFIGTLEAENGLWRIDRVSKKNRNGTQDFGLCQLNSRYHSNFIKSPDFKDYKKQINYCWKVYQARPTAFYGYFKRHKAKLLFTLSQPNKK